MNLCVCGLGYVGSVTAACLAKAGHTVVGVDISPAKVEPINAGTSPVIEEGLTELIAESVRAKRLSATTDMDYALARSDITLIAVGTPSRANGSLDTAALERSCVDIGRALRRLGRPHTIVVRSTVLPGTCHDLLIPVLENASRRECDENFGVCHNPEFMREGTSVADFYTPPFTVIGADDDRHGARAAALYAMLPSPAERTSIEVSEMLKYACNAFHALKAVFANEIGDFAAANNVDGREVMRLLCLDRKLNISTSYLRPGFAFGGSCLPKDLRALLHRARQTDLNLPLLSSILPSNGLQLQRGLEMIYRTGKRRIGMLGLTFKAGTDDLRESPYVEVAETLLGKGYELRIHDENISLNHLVGANEAYINSHLPHIARQLETFDGVLEESEVVVVCNNNPRYSEAVRHLRPDQEAIDLVGLPVLKPEAVAVQGIAW